ncbi:hypothetical protein HMPREF9016_00731 [Neisseria sp. oral taxon 014 str. F0314]|nr:hypothetical protein HMPREF9016_00731 [Neisseria sp. oral taxon 014 str. F0314]
MRLKRVPTAFLRPLPPLILIKRPEAAFFYAFYVPRPSENLFFIKNKLSLRNSRYFPTLKFTF